ncbi:hypothetical protein QYE76_017351 [Lolium multiflorum]|uniref:ubiquitinyl hydrolase 1 n=1 Tax=Lolium multiflorum TaxID=4521 RepID=A0AAD8UXQ0_LOLMU|nr:hypothetical protein QYE76_017351 [Lolium multiflorum]
MVVVTIVLVHLVAIIVQDNEEFFGRLGLGGAEKRQRQCHVNQEKESFTRADLDGISENLALTDPNKDKWTPLSLIWKPHHNALTGNYDVNVLIAALEARKKKVVWHDHRKGASSIDLDAEALAGLMINVPVRRFRGLWSGRHWVAIRSVDGVWFNLDSDLSSAKQFQGKEELIVFLDSVLSQGGELMIVLQDE